MAPKVYLETSVISYLTARPARDVVALAHQELTREWWEKQRTSFDLYSSEIVFAEAEKGNPEAARARLEILRLTRRLSASEEAEQLVPVLLRRTGLPMKALADMSHIALATVHACSSCDVELQAHRQRASAQNGGQDVPRARLRTTSHLHA